MPERHLGNYDNLKKYMFQRKSVFELDSSDELDVEELELNLIDAGIEELELINNNFDLDHLPLTDSVVCKLEVDLIKWLADLSGREGWEVYSNNEFESYSTFLLREGNVDAEVTLYQGGYAQVDLDGKSVFYGDLLKDSVNNVHMSYYAVDSGEKIILQ